MSNSHKNSSGGSLSGPYYIVYWHTSAPTLAALVANIVHVSHLSNFVRHRVKDNSALIQVEGREFRTKRSAQLFLSQQFHLNGDRVWLPSKNGVYFTYPCVVGLVPGGAK